MTYSESEHSALLRNIADITEDKNKNPFEAFFSIKKLMAIYKKMPVYPGVVPEIFEQGQYEVDEKTLDKGDYVLLYSEKDCIAGTVKENNDGVLKLNHLGKLTEYKSKTFDTKNITKAYCVNERPKKEIIAIAPQPVEQNEKPK